MKIDGETVHATHREKNRHWQFLLLLIPSIVFVLVLAFFLRSKNIATNQVMTALGTPMPTFQLQINDTTVQVKIAKSQNEQRQGLSGVSILPENEGMLFVFASKSQTPFWMKDMMIPLDLIWIRDGKIIQIDKNVPVPKAGSTDKELKLYLPTSSVDQVLEVNSGFSDKHGIKVGDSVLLPAL